MMRRKYALTAIIAVTLVSWIYWSSNRELNNTILVLTTNNHFYRDVIIEPNNKTCEQNNFLVIIVTSYVGHVELRSAHRRAMSPEVLKSVNATRVFLLAKIPETEKYITQAAINDENNIFGDILQGSFVENYRNLTFKHLMGLQWASTVCNKATYILKVDDDTVFNLEKTYELLIKINYSENLFMGYILNNTRPRRNKQNKWYVTWKEYPRNSYPPYLSGWYYITTPQVAAKICEEAVYHPKFWIDDILVTGLLTESLSIKLRQLPKDYWLEYYELVECCLKDMINKSIKCEYAVGPNGGRNNLIVEFNEALHSCDKIRNCTQRTLDKPLKNVCVINGGRSIFSDGQAEVQPIRLK